MLEQGTAAPAMTIEELYDRFGPDLYAYACALAPARDAAEDALQELFVKLAVSRVMERVQSAQDLRGYLFAMLRNEVFRRALRSKRTGARDLAAGALRFEEAARGAPVEPEEIARLEREMAGLPGEQREAVFLKVWQGMTFAEIAQLTDIPPDTAASRYRYGIEKLRKGLGTDGEDGKTQHG